MNSMIASKALNAIKALDQIESQTKYILKQMQTQEKSTSKPTESSKLEDQLFDKIFADCLLDVDLVSPDSKQDWVSLMT